MTRKNKMISYRTVEKSIAENGEITLIKSAELTRHKIIVPTFYIDNYGYDFAITCYKDKMVIEPKSLYDKKHKADTEA